MISTWGQSRGFDIASFYSGGKPGFTYDFTNKSKLFQLSDGTMAVTADNDPIGFVTDLSGNGKHSTALTAERPLFVSGSGAVCDGTKGMTAGVIDFTGINKLTVIACVQTASGANQGVFSHDGDARLLMSGSLGGFYAAQLDLTLTVANGRGTPSATPRVVTAVFDRAGLTALTEVSTRINGEAYSQNVASGGAYSAAGNFASSATWVMSTSGLNLNGKLLRIMVVGGLLTPDQLFAAEYWSGQAGGLGLISEFPPAGNVYYSLLNSYGQSLSVGGNSIPPLSTTTRFAGDTSFSMGVDNPTLDYTSLIPLIERAFNVSGTPCGETPISGMAEMVHERGYGYNFIGVASGFPATTIAGLSIGTSPYNNFKDSVLNGWRRSREQYNHFKVRAFTWMQGESDNGNTTYAASLGTLRTNLNTDIKAITLQTDDVWCLSYQIANTQIGLEHLKAQETYSNIRVAMPTYQLPKVDNAHLTNTSSKVAGAYFGLAYKAIIVDGNTAWKPLMVTSSAVSGANVDLTYNVPGGVLALDTTIVAAQTNSGFRLVDSGGSLLAISSVSITGVNTVRIVAAATVPAGAKVYYGFSDPTSGTTGAGNLRDTQGATIVFDGGGLNYPMHNWALLQSVAL